MSFQFVLGGALATMLMSVAAADARDATSATHQRDLQHSVGGLPGVFVDRQDGGEIQMAQAATDPRVVALEDQIRALNGTMEELNFQILQLQEQIRKMQEDNEFRFQELEKKKSDAGGKTDRTVAETTPADVGKTVPAQGGSVEDVIASDQTAAAGNPNLGAPPKTFGTLSVDPDGLVKDSAAGAAPATGQDNAVVAALPKSDDPEELYRTSYQFILSGDYTTAESGFRDHISRFPQSERAPDAHFWLGEAFLGQQKYRDAAETFLAASKEYPKSKKAPDMLLKLGVSLVGLNQNEVACATYGEIDKRYPNASAALKDRVKQERARAAC